MELHGERLIPASLDATRAALNDPETLKACIAGCESLERTGPDAYTAVVAMRIGPVSARFKGNLQMTNVDAPNGYTIAFSDNILYVNVEIRESPAKRAMDSLEGLRADENRIRIRKAVGLAFRMEHFVNRCFALLVPDLLKPAP